MQHPSTSKTTPWALTLGAIALLSGCGGGGSSSDAQPHPIPLLAFSNGQAASVVIGQTDFDGNQANQGGSVDAYTVNRPNGNPTIHDGVLYLPDSGNHRVLGFSNGIPTINNMFASFILGQNGWTDSSSGTTDAKFSVPKTVVSHEGKLFLADGNNQRVLIWNEAPIGNVGADVVVGQADMTSVDTDNSCSQNRLGSPGSVIAAGGKLFVADASNNRVLIWSSIPTQNGQPADLVLGQADFESCIKNRAVDEENPNGIPAADTLFWPVGIWSDGKRLLVADMANSRVLIWSSLPTYNGQPADVVLGQPDMNSNEKGTSRTQLNLPIGLHTNGRQLFVADTSNHRVLIWDSIPSTNNAPADRVLGQPDFTSSTRAAGASGLDFPRGGLYSETSYWLTTQAITATSSTKRHKSQRFFIWQLQGDKANCLVPLVFC